MLNQRLKITPTEFLGRTLAEFLLEAFLKLTNLTSSCPAKFELAISSLCLRCIYVILYLRHTVAAADRVRKRSINRAVQPSYFVVKFIP